MDIDAGLLISICKKEDPTLLSKVDRSWISSEYLPILDFIQEFLTTKELRKLPRVETLIAEFDLDPSLEKVQEDPHYFLREVRKRSAAHFLEDQWANTILPLIEDPLKSKPFDAAKVMMELGYNLKKKYMPVEAGDRVDFLNDVRSRVELYAQRKSRHGMLGVPWPFDPLNRCTGGIIKGELNIIIARAHMGKTWFLILSALKALEEGYKVMFLSQEMRPERLVMRIDAMLARVNPDRFRRGALEKEEEKRYADTLNRLKDYVQHGQYFNVYGPKDISSFMDYEILLSQNADKYDVVYWDSPYLLIRKEAWEHRAEFVYNLNRSTEDYDTRLVGTWQFNKSFTSNNKSHANTSQAAAYTDSINTDSDNIIVLSQTDDQKQIGQMDISTSKTRDGLRLESMLIEWDIMNFNFEMLSYKIPGVGSGMGKLTDYSAGF